MRLPVLLYHHVGPARAGACPALTVSPERFERHVRWLASCGYIGIRASDWHAHVRGASLRSRPVLLTFDDAYADIVEHALPVLDRYRFGAVVMVVTGRVGGESDWDRRHGWVPHPLMTADQIRAWAERGVEFGAHSRTHADLTMVSDEDLETEIQGSCDDLSAIVGRRATAFAYPYGHVDDRVSRRVRKTYDIAFSCVEGMNTSETDVHLLRRSMVQPHESRVGLTCRVRAGRYPIDRWRARLRIRSRLRRAAASLRYGEL